MNIFGRWCVGEVRARRLGFEYLERRDLLTMMRLVDWNTFNNPNDVEDEINFATVLAAIGNESIEGHTQRLDILAVQETDPAVSPGNNSIGKLESILDGLYPSTDYASVVSSVDGGGDSTGFVYDTSSLSLLESVEVLPGSITHKVLRGKFRPESTLGESDFYVYSIHLKSGSSGQDKTDRANEAFALRANADALGEGAHVLFVGDFNMQSSSELAYVNLVSAGSAHLRDLAGEDADGDWLDNPDFIHLHSQDPGATMDDRFDIMFGTDEFYDGTGLEFVDNSYRVFGNDGSHTLNGMITSGTGADPAVLAALVEASDHLPIVSDFEILSGPGVRIVETGGQTKVAEGGNFDTYDVVLNTIPAANVTITVSPDAELDLGNGPGVAVNLLFTPGNALTPQQIIVNATDDLDLEGTHSGLVTHTSVSADANYNGLSIEELSVVVLDDDAPVIVINEIDSDTSGTDVAEFVELYDGGIGNVSLDGLTLVFFNGATDTAYASFNLNGQFTDANGFFVLGNSAIPGVDLTFTNGTLQNGADAVALYSGTFAIGGAVTTTNLIDAIVYDTSDADDAELLVLLQSGQPQVNENQNSQGDSQSLSRVPDGGNPRETVTYVAQTPTPGAPNQTNAPGVLITQSGGGLNIGEGGPTDTYQIALLSTPSANVSITVDPDGETDLGSGPGVAIVLTFTVENALVPQIVTVAAVNDSEIEGTHSSIITHTATSADAGYNGFSIPNVTASITDNDSAPATPIVITEIMYSPASDEEAPGVGEWIEIVNTGGSAFDLSGWLFDDEDTSNWGEIPNGTMLNPGQVAVFYDVAFTDVATFRAEWSVPISALVVGITWGNLSNSPGPGNEVLVLLNASATVMDTVNFDDTAPWPTTPSDGPSIFLTNVGADNSAGNNWARSAVGVDGAVSPSGPTFMTTDVGSPGSVPAVGELAGDYNDNGTVDAADYSVWRDTVGSTTDFRADGSGLSVGVPDGVVDVLDFDFWKANFGNSLGSGSSSLVSGRGNGGGMQLTVAADEPVVESPSASPLDLVKNEIQEENSLAFDPAWFDVEADALSSSASVTSGDSLSAADSDDLLLVLTRVSISNTPERFDGAVSDAVDFADIDEFFATLDERALAVGLL